MIQIAPLNDAFAIPGGANAGLELRCPRCHGPMGEPRDADPAKDAAILCARCGFSLRREQGIWRALLPERQAYFARFMEDYASIRLAEGRGSASADYYLHLPYRDLSGRNAAQWALRARTFRYIEQRLLPALEAGARRRLRILDLGAGNCWMSYRLALHGRALTAVDLQTNEQDGLGAGIHYKGSLAPLFPRFQAAVDNLPFAGRQFDLVIFNASFHYSEDYSLTLAEAIRCTCAGGTVLIADTPWYRKDASGRRMLEERRALFTARYGTPSDAIASLEYLTDRRLREMETAFGIRWRIDRPYYGIRWSLRPLLAKLRGRREPSRFRIYTAQVNP